MLKSAINTLVEAALTSGHAGECAVDGPIARRRRLRPITVGGDLRVHVLLGVQIEALLEKCIDVQPGGLFDVSASTLHDLVVSRVGDFPFHQKVVDRLRRVANRETGARARENLIGGLDSRFWGGKIHGSSFSITSLFF